MILKLFFAINFAIVALAFLQVRKSWDRFHLPMAIPVFWFCVLLVVRAVVNIGEFLTDYQVLPLLAHDIWLQCFFFIPPLWVWMMWEYAFQRKEWRFVFLLLEPVIITLAFWTNDWHGLMFDSVITTQFEGMTQVSRNIGILRKFHMLFVIGLWNISAIWISIILWRKPPSRKREAIMFFFLMFGIEGLYSFYLLDIIPVPLGSVLFLIILSWAIYVNRVLDILPIARQFMMDKLTNGIMVLNDKNEIVDYNDKFRSYVDVNIPKIHPFYTNDHLPLRLRDQFDWRSNEIQKNTFSLDLSRAGEIDELQLESSLSPLYEKDQVVGKILTINDITEKVMVQRQREYYTVQLEKSKVELENLNQLKTNLFSNITHEFRTPLTLIIEPVRQLLREVKDERILPRLSIVKRNSENLLSLVNQLLDMLKADEGKLLVNLAKINPLDLIRTTFESFNVLAHDKNLTLTLECEGQIESFYCDEIKLIQILQNLLSNAIKFTDSGHVTIRMETAKNTFLENDSIDDLVLTISDTGMGISEPEIDRIFDRFYQVDSSHTRKGEGTGIGLALTKNLLELMNGRITVESEIGKGTTMQCYIPMLSSPTYGQNGIEVSSSTEKNLATKLPQDQNAELENNISIILLIEDNSDLRGFIGQSIGRDYKIVEAVDGRDGMDKAKTFLPDLIISDVMMPYIDGYELTDILKTDHLTSHIPIILLTAKSSTDSRIVGLKSGADAYIGKPFDTEELIVRIEKLIESRKLLQERYRNQIPMMTISDIEKPELVSSSVDIEFLANLNAIINQNMDDSEFSVEILSQQLFMSRSQLFRKVKAITGQSPNEFIRNYRLDFAKRLLESKKGSISEVAAKVGFADDKYFSRRFSDRFGVPPSGI